MRVCFLLPFLILLASTAFGDQPKARQVLVRSSFEDPCAPYFDGTAAKMTTYSQSDGPRSCPWDLRRRFHMVEISQDTRDRRYLILKTVSDDGMEDRFCIDALDAKSAGLLSSLLTGGDTPFELIYQPRRIGVARYNEGDLDIFNGQLFREHPNDMWFLSAHDMRIRKAGSNETTSLSTVLNAYFGRNAVSWRFRIGEFVSKFSVVKAFARGDARTGYQEDVKVAGRMVKDFWTWSGETPGKIPSMLNGGTATSSP